MITIEQAKPGTAVKYGDQETVILTGHYEDPDLGLMIKSSLYPGGMPAANYEIITPDGDTPTGAQVMVETAIPAVSFELAIIDEKEPVKLTAHLIREKSKALTDLTITNYLDEAGIKAVKAAKQKAIKTRTSIEKKEEEVLKGIKSRHKDELKEVTDYTAELYTACREAEKNLGDKLTKVDEEKAAAAKKLADEEKERTEGRDNAMYGLGMTFNGQAFVGYGKSIIRENLHSLAEENYTGIITELEALKMEQDITGEVKPAPVNVSSMTDEQHKSFVSRGGYSGGSPVKGPVTVADEQINPFSNAVHTRIIGNHLVYLTRGEVTPVIDQVIINDRVLDSAIYLQAVIIRNSEPTG